LLDRTTGPAIEDGSTAQSIASSLPIHPNQPYSRALLQDKSFQT
jgi:hypothetical protein